MLLLVMEKFKPLKVVITSDDITRKTVENWVWRLPRTEKFLVTITEFKAKRNLAQNNLFHKWVTEINKKSLELTGKAWSDATWKIYLKDMFLGYESVQMPDGRFSNQLRHTSDLKVGEFAEFLTHVEHWARESMDYQLPHLADLYYESMGMQH